MSNDNSSSGMEVYEDQDFSYEGFQVVRGEFFAHTYEPSFTLNNNRVSVNTACIKKLPEFEYIQILVNPDDKKLAVRPCSEDEKDAFRWCSATAKRSPKQITCPVFFAKIRLRHPHLVPASARFRSVYRTIPPAWLAR